MPQYRRRVTVKPNSVSKAPVVPCTVEVFAEQLRKALGVLYQKRRLMPRYEEVLVIDFGVVPLTDFKRYLKEFFKSIGIKKPTRVPSEKGDFYQDQVFYKGTKIDVGAGLLVDGRNKTQVFMYVNRLEE